MTGKVEKEILKLAKVKGPDKGEERQAFLQRVALAADKALDLSGDAWDDLTPEAQDWINAAAKANKKKTAFPEFEAAEESEESSPAKATKTAAKAKEKDTADKPAKAAKPAGDGVSSMYFIRRHLAKDPKASIDEIRSALEKGGYKVPSNVTITTVRSDFRSTIRVLTDLKLLTKELAL